MNNLINKKYRSLLVASTLGVFVEAIPPLTNNIIAGQILGAQSLAALSLIFPIFQLTMFLMYFLSYGVSIRMSQEIGNMNRKRANELFSNGVILCVICGAICSLSALLFKTEILKALNIPEEIYSYTESYFSCILWLPLLAPLSNALYGVVVVEGNEKLAIIASIGHLVVNFIFSPIFCLWTGIAGIAIGDLSATLLVMVILSLHFFRKDNEVRLFFRISWKDFITTTKYSLCTSFSYLYSCISFLIINSYISLNYGIEMLVAFGGVMVIQSFIISGLSSLDCAMSPLIGVFHGEKNMVGVKRVIKLAMKYTLLASAAICVFLYMFGRPTEWILGIKEGAAAEYALMGIYIFAPASLFIGILQILIAYYVFSEKQKAAVYISTMLNLVFQITLPLSLEKWLGINGIWLGLLLAPVCTLLLALPSLKLIYKRDTLPFLINKVELENWKYCTATTDSQSFMAMVSETELFLREKNVPNQTVMKAMLLVEEMCISVRDKNKMNVVNVDCSVHVEDGVNLIFRDDGKSVDFSEVDSEVSSLQNFLTSSIIESYSSRHYMRTTGFNRITFYIPAFSKETTGKAHAEHEL